MPKINREFSVAELKLLLEKAEEKVLQLEKKVKILTKELKEHGMSLPTEKEIEEKDLELAAKKENEDKEALVK